MPAQRQTISYLTRRFADAGLQPDNRRGQNFLIDLNLVRLLANSAEITTRDVVLEVGTGTGSLTALLAERARRVVTVEIDTNLVQLAGEALLGCDNVEILQQDALKNKNRFHPAVIDAVESQLELSGATAPSAAPDRGRIVPNFKLAANLPYNIATPIVSNLLSTHIVPATMTVTIQKELAERIVARPKTKDYGALSVWIQSQCDAHIVRVMPPTVFWPRPKVESAIIHIAVNTTKRDRIPDLEGFHTFVRSIFLHRRKFLRGVMLANYKKQLDKPTIDALMKEHDLGATARAEELDVQMMLRLSQAVRQLLDERADT